MSPPNELPRTVQSSWHGFLETYEPLRTDLYRYCRHLTRSPWDAEDLAQDSLARAFVTLGQMGDAPPSPRAWLFRVASNLWIDRARRRRREEPLAGEPHGWVLLHWYSHRDGDAVRAVTRRPDRTAIAGSSRSADLSPFEVSRCP